MSAIEERNAMKELMVIRDALKGVVAATPAKPHTHLGFDVMFAGLKGSAVTSSHFKVDQGRSTKHTLSFMSDGVSVTYTFIENGTVFMTLPGVLTVGGVEHAFSCNHSAVVFEDKVVVEGPLVREIITAIKHFI